MRQSFLRPGLALGVLTLAAVAAWGGDPAPVVPVGHLGQVNAEPTVHHCVGGCGKVCREVPDVKKITKWVYCCKEEDYCAPRILPPCLWHLCGGCACGVPRTKHFLVKKAVVTECPTTKCVVEGGCGSGPGAIAAAPAGSVPARLPGSDPSKGY
jgi:hypothetical protein